MEDMQKKAEKALATVKAVIDEGGLATINGRDYKFEVMTHKTRRKVFAFYTKVSQELKAGNFSFLDSNEWDAIESLICEFVTFDGVQLSKRADHWDKFAADYLKFISTALPVISYPFLDGNRTN